MNISVIGTGITKFGELWDKTLEDLSLEASLSAIKESGLKKDQIDAVFVGNMLYGKLSGQDHLGVLISQLLGLKVPAVHIEAACASGGAAIQTAIQALKSGDYKNVLVLGVEKMTDYSISEITAGLMGAGSQSERDAGLTFPALYALMARAHMQKYGTTRKHLASVSVKNHLNASFNPNAQFPYEIDFEKALSAPFIAEPFTIFDASPITDGAAAVILSSENTSGISIIASQSATDSLDLAGRENLESIPATKEASLKAYKEAGITASDIDVAEVHDCFTIAEIMAMEDLGFCKKGDGGKFVFEGNTKLNGKISVNTSGGLKACGHPVGATGVKQIIEITNQLKGLLPQRQVKNPQIGLTQNVGGTGATVVIHILKKEDK